MKAPEIPVVPSAEELSAKERLVKAISTPAPVATPSPSTLPDEVALGSKATSLQTPTEGGGAAPTSGFERLRGFINSPLRPLHTFKEDVEDAVKKSNASLISIAAKEEVRRGAQSKAHEEVSALPTRVRSRVFLIFAIIALFTIGIGVLLVVFLRSGPERPQEFFPTSPIFVDESVELPLGDLTARELLETLTALRNDTTLSLGLVRQVFATEVATTGEKRIVPPATFLRRLATRSPDALLRTLKGPYLVGIHVFDDNQPFLLFTVDSFEQSFAAMLAWEPYLAEDLRPLFPRNPGPRSFGGGVIAPSLTVIPSIFRDRIVENKDTRVLTNEYGDILLLWTFLDRDTLFITTNEGTLREGTTRIKNAPLEERPDNQ